MSQYLRDLELSTYECNYSALFSATGSLPMLSSYFPDAQVESLVQSTSVQVSSFVYFELVSIGARFQPNKLPNKC
jgi:hypothetical protein